MDPGWQVEAAVREPWAAPAGPLRSLGRESGVHTDPATHLPAGSLQKWGCSLLFPPFTRQPCRLQSFWTWQGTEGSRQVPTHGRSGTSLLALSPMALYRRNLSGCRRGGRGLGHGSLGPLAHILSIAWGYQDLRSRGAGK